MPLGSSDYSTAVLLDDSEDIYIIGYCYLTVAFNPGSGVYEYGLGDTKCVFLTKFDNQGKYQWVRLWFSQDDIFVSSGALNDKGEIYMTGAFSGTMDFDSGPGKSEHASRGGQDVFLFKVSEDGELIWGRSFGGKGYDRGRAVTTDGAGNIYVSGQFMNTVDFSPDESNRVEVSNGDYDIFLIKLDDDGDVIWSTAFGGSREETCTCISTDASEAIFIGGGFYSEIVDFDPSGRVDNHKLAMRDAYSQHSGGSEDAFISKFDLDGVFQWARTWGGNDFDEARHIAILNQRCLYVSDGAMILRCYDYYGSVTSSTELPSPATFALDAFGDIFVANGNTFITGTVSDEANLKYGSSINGHLEDRHGSIILIRLCLNDGS